MNKALSYGAIPPKSVAAIWVGCLGPVNDHLGLGVLTKPNLRPPYSPTRLERSARPRCIHPPTQLPVAHVPAVIIHQPTQLPVSQTFTAVGLHFERVMASTALTGVILRTCIVTTRAEAALFCEILILFIHRANSSYLGCSPYRGLRFLTYLFVILFHYFSLFGTIRSRSGQASCHG